MTRVLLLENPHSCADDVFAAHGFEIVRHVGALDEDELIDALDGVDIVGIRSKTEITQRVIDAHPGLSAIGCFCIGTKQVDLAAAARSGIAVFNAPYSNTRSVVELALGEIIAMARRLTTHNSLLHRGFWDKTATGSHEVRGRTLGIIGYGSIGSQLSVLAESLGMNVVFYDIGERLAMGNARRMNSMKEVFEVADTVSLHVDDRPSNRNLIGDREFRQMRRRACLINLSRGFVVDQDALAKHLSTGHIAGAAVDVYPTEPKGKGAGFESPLRGMDNVILTPHIGGSTQEAQLDIGRFVAAKLSDYLDSASTDMAVNLPQLSLRPSDNAQYRVALIHRNTPGVLALVNQTFAEHGANIEGQILGTHGEAGYVITDISSELPIDAIAAISSMDDTIRLRVLTSPTW